MKKNNILMVALLGAVACVSCQEAFEIEEKQQPVEPATKWTLTVQATKGVETKALDLKTEGGNDVLDTYWVNGEKVAVFSGKEYLGDLTAAVDASNKQKATLSATWDKMPDDINGATLTLLFPRNVWDYTGQTGVAPAPDGALSSTYDYALATVTAKVEKNTITTSPANVMNQQNIYRFGFRKTDDKSAISVHKVVVSSKNLVTLRTFDGDWKSKKGEITVEQPASSSLELLYAALRIEQETAADEELLFKVFGANSDYYEGTQTIPAGYLTNGKFISAKGVKVEQLKLPTKDATPAKTF